jgi:hypothetical protein
MKQEQKFFDSLYKVENGIELTSNSSVESSPINEEEL